MDKKLLPVGIDDFKKLIDDNYYYVDKTLLIKDLLDNLAAVNLFTRPRRFGKTLNLSMLRYFFERPVENSKSRAYLFEDKKIVLEGRKYTDHQERYPVIHLSLKSGRQSEFKLAYEMLKSEIIQEYERHRYVLDALESNNHRIYQRILDNTADDSVWYRSIAFLSRCLETYYGQTVVILLDEYDVPLENAYYCGFYDEMTGFIRSLSESAFKSNPALKFAVITGCLRISKESVFTGLNNLDTISILNTVYKEHFGFTREETAKLLSDYHITAKAEQIREWYDGYIFGRTEVYNPWSVINYIRSACVDENALPVEYWSNTSSNSIIKNMLAKADDTVRDEIETLMQHGAVVKPVFEAITYQDIYESPDNLWNFLCFTGYLKAVKIWMRNDERVMELKIPNKEIRNIYRHQITQWFRHEIQSRDLSLLFEAVLSGREELLQKELSGLLGNSISYMDNYEAFYHGFLLGTLTNMEHYKVTSNREAGDGRYDLCIVSRNDMKPPVILEFKIAAKNRLMQEAAEQALQQITKNRYDIPFEDDGYKKCIHIGIGFCRKMCVVKCETVTF